MGEKDLYKCDTCELIYEEINCINISDGDLYYLCDDCFNDRFSIQEGKEVIEEEE